MPIERKLAAIMFTDIAGYTALSAKDETSALKLLDIQKLILTPIIKEFNGTLHKEMGDGLLFTFPTVTDAVNCGIKIQEATKANDDLNLRIGIHEGEITLKDGDALGDDVNVASRIEAFAPSGGIAISGKVQQNISSLPEFETKFISQPSLKGVRQEVKVYCITSHGLPKADITKITARLEKDVKKIWINQKSIIRVIVVLGILVLGIILWIGENNEKSQIIDNEIYTQINQQAENPYFADTVLLNDLTTDIKILETYKNFWSKLMKFDTTLIYSSVSDSIYSFFSQEILSGLISMFPYSKVVTFRDLKQSFAAQGKILDKQVSIDDYYKDKYLPWGVGFGFYIYKIENNTNDDQYSLIIESRFNSAHRFQIINADKDLLVDEILVAINRQLEKSIKSYIQAKVKLIQNDNLIVSLEKGSNVRNGTILSVHRKYINGYMNISDEGVQYRIKDLKELHDCFQSNLVWQESINEKYYWSYNEYDDLINKNQIKIKATGGTKKSLGIYVKIEEVFDSTASAIIIEREFPECIKIKTGDLLYLK